MSASLHIIPEPTHSALISAAYRQTITDALVSRHGRMLRAERFEIDGRVEGDAVVEAPAVS